MKVLMLGWEYPPHISGGLGTACAGLTQALEKEDVDILFVVPKLHGGEHADRTTFVSASTIPIRQKKIISEEEQLSNNRAEVNEPEHAYGELTATTRARIETIEVSSLLTPYTSPSEASAPASLHRWNYIFESNDRTVPAGLRPYSSGLSGESRKAINCVKEPYSFSGTYGTKLLEEVERYSQTAAEIARRHSFDVIHAHDWMTYQAGIAARKVSGKPLVVHVHATEIDRSGARVNERIFDIEKLGMRLADKVVTVSHWTKNIALRHYGITGEKIEVIHNGVQPRENGAVRFSTPPFGSPMITFVGRITHQKGPMHFVEAARKVHDQFPNAHFVVAGAGDQLPMMIERIAQLRLSGKFHFTGFLRGEDVDKIWAMSNVYVMPSVSEPFGIAPLEAIQAGVPVILSKQAGVGEVMPHAIKVDFWNSDAFAEAICNVLRFKSLANTLKKNGAEEIKNITWEKAARKLTTLYHELSSKQNKTKKSRSVFSGTSTQKTAQPAVL
jgi:glycogen synthase